MDTVDRIKTVIAKHDMTIEEAAQYLGVPVGTLVKWLNGTRKPTSSAVRLVEVLGVIETLAPFIHDHLLP